MTKTKIRLGLLLTVVVIAVLYTFWMPLPDARARDAVGDEKSVARDGRSISYHVIGQGAPVVLLASAGREASDFNELIGSLNAEGYRTIAVEAPGINGSTLPKKEMSLFDMADDVAVVDNAELEAGERFTILGHAFGNRVARAFATGYDDQVNGVILIAAGGKKAVPEQANVALKAVFDPRRTVSQRKADIAFAFFAQGNPIPDHWVTGWHRHTAILQGKATPLMKDNAWLAGGTKPMLVLQAVEDAIAPNKDAGEPLATEFPDRVKLVIVEKAGHALLPEQPEAISIAVLAFLSRLD